MVASTLNLGVTRHLWWCRNFNWVETTNKGPQTLSVVYDDTQLHLNIGDKLKSPFFFNTQLGNLKEIPANSIKWKSCIGGCHTRSLRGTDWCKKALLIRGGHWQVLRAPKVGLENKKNKYSGEIMEWKKPKLHMGAFHNRHITED